MASSRCWNSDLIAFVLAIMLPMLPTTVAMTTDRRLHDDRRYDEDAAEQVDDDEGELGVCLRTGHLTDRHQNHRRPVEAATTVSTLSLEVAPTASSQSWLSDIDAASTTNTIFHTQS